MVAFREAFSQARAILNLKPNDKIALGKRNAQIKKRNCLKGLSKPSSAVFMYPSRASEEVWMWLAGTELQSQSDLSSPRAIAWELSWGRFG